MNWKHGGSLTFGQIIYRITPQANRYVPGVCHVWVYEDEGQPVDNTGPVQVFLRASATDQVGNVMAGRNYGDTFPATYQSMNLSGPMQNNIIITPENAGAPKDYIQFTAGTDSWVSSNKDRCNTNNFNTPAVGDGVHVSADVSS